MARDYTWIALGIGWGKDDDPADRRRFECNAWIASAFLDQAIPPPEDARHIYLALEQDAAQAEPDVSKLGKRGDGGHLFAVRCNWLTEELMNEASGPWQLVAVVMLILATLEQRSEFSLPKLT
jgi:hypothetical protein